MRLRGVEGLEKSIVSELHPADRGGQGPDQVAPEFWIVQIRGRIAR